MSVKNWNQDVAIYSALFASYSIGTTNIFIIPVLL